MLTSNHLHFTFASLMVSKRDVAADLSLNVTHSLAKREYFPPDQLCDAEEDWIWRRCIDSVSDQLWVDLCVTITTNDTPVVYMRTGVCRDDKICFDMLVDRQDPDDPSLAETSVCLDRPTRLIVVTIDSAGISIQTGVIPVVGGVDPKQTMSIQVEYGASKASVTGFIEGTNNAIIPSANIFGSLTGTSQNPSACNWNSTNRVCVPSGRNDIAELDSIAFTYNLPSNEKGNFYYAVIGS